MLDQFHKADKFVGVLMALKLPSTLGFRSGNRGTHTSRTIMLAELSALFTSVGTDADRLAYLTAIVEDNALGKVTASTRKSSAQRLSELYGLDRAIPIFRMLTRLWNFDPVGQPLSAMLVAMARDPLLRATAAPVLALPAGATMDRDAIADALRRAVGSRLNESTLAKVVRTSASSWSQSGHLVGRTFKKRRIVTPTAGPVIMALLLAYLQGSRGIGILQSLWCQALDANPDTIARLASTASMSGLLRFRKAGDVVEITFPDLLTAQEREALDEPS